MKRTKRIVAWMLSLVLMASVFGVAPEKPAAAETKVETMGVVGCPYFSVVLPDSLAGKVIAFVGDTYIDFYSKKVYDASLAYYSKQEGMEGEFEGSLCTLAVFDHENDLEVAPVATELGRDGGQIYALLEPSDVQSGYNVYEDENGNRVEEYRYGKDAADEYDALAKDTALWTEILSSFAVKTTLPSGEVTLKKAKNVKGKKISVSVSWKADTRLILEALETTWDCQEPMHCYWRENRDLARFR